MLVLGVRRDSLSALRGLMCWLALFATATKLDRDFDNSDTFRAWLNIFDRISSGAMPPATEPRPGKQAKNAALTFLKTQILEVNRSQYLTHGRVPSRNLLLSHESDAIAQATRSSFRKLGGQRLRNRAVHLSSV